MKPTRTLPYLSVLMVSWLWVSAGCDRSPRPEGDSEAPTGASQAPAVVSEKPQEVPKKDVADQKPAARANTAANPSDKPTVESAGKRPGAPAPGRAMEVGMELPDSGQSVETLVREEFRPDGGLMREWHVRIMPDGTEVKHGRWSAYHKDGGIYLDGYYDNGERDGKWPSWYPSGELRGTGQFESGKKAGTWSHYHENGQKKAEYRFVDGLKEGTFTVWDKDGNVTEQGEYVRDQKHGTWITVDPGGNRIETHWINGVQQD